MEISLPKWDKAYESRITEQAWNKLIAETQALLSRALEIYEAYLRTSDVILYEVYYERLQEAYPNLRMMAMICPEEMNKLGDKLVKDAEASLQATFLYDLAGVFKG